MVARGAGVAGPVLLACHQWDPRGLARRLPSLGAGAWRGAPLLPWRVQCPGRVCAALAASSGGSGRYLVLCLPPFPLPAPCVLRCVWWAVRSGCPLPSLAGMPFHAVCAFRGLVRLPFRYSPCVLCVSVRSRSRGVLSVPPLSWLVWRAHLARSRCWALVGPFHAVRAPPPVLPWCRAPFGLLGGGAALSRFPPTWLGAVRSPWGGSVRLGRFSAGRWGRGGAGAVRRAPRMCRQGGPVRRGVALPQSVPLPSQGRQQSGCPWCRSRHGGRGPHTAPVCARLLSPGAVRVAPWRVGAGSLVLRGSCGSRRLGCGGGPCSGLPLGRRLPAGGRGDHPLCLGGGWGPAPPWLAGRWGGLGGQGGGSRRDPPAVFLGGGGLPLPTQHPFRCRRIPPWRTRLVGVVGQPRAPVAACCRQVSLAGGGGGGVQTAHEPPTQRL